MPGADDLLDAALAWGCAQRLVKRDETLIEIAHGVLSVTAAWTHWIGLNGASCRTATPRASKAILSP